MTSYLKNYSLSSSPDSKLNCGVSVVKTNDRTVRNTAWNVVKPLYSFYNRSAPSFSNWPFNKRLKELKCDLDPLKMLKILFLKN